jgi:hypothetical protein
MKKSCLLLISFCSIFVLSCANTSRTSSENEKNSLSESLNTSTSNSSATSYEEHESKPYNFYTKTKGNEMSSPSVTYQTSFDTYYPTSLTGLKGSELLNSLASLLDNTHLYYTSYDDVRGAMAYADEDYYHQDQIIELYTGANISNTWNNGTTYNREHVWCKNLSGDLYKNVTSSTRGAGSDIHQLKPCLTSINSSRGDKPYADLNQEGTSLIYNNKNTGTYYSGTGFEPRNSVKGDIARILMYMYTHYSNEISANASHSDTTKGNTSGALAIQNIVYTSLNTAQASWDLLLKWNQLDPVDSFEMKRNEYCASITGVRNPYIDHPEFAEMIFSTSYNGEGALKEGSFYVNTESLAVLKGDYLKLEATEGVTYYSGNDIIAKVDENGYLLGRSAGQVNISITYQNITKVLKIYVIDLEKEYQVKYYVLNKNNEYQFFQSQSYTFNENITPLEGEDVNDKIFTYWTSNSKNPSSYDFSYPIREDITLYGYYVNNIQTEASSFMINFYDASKVTDTNGESLTTTILQQKTIMPSNMKYASLGLTFATSDNNKTKINKKGGLTLGTKSAGGDITFTINNNYTISKVEVVAVYHNKNSTAATLSLTYTLDEETINAQQDGSINGTGKTLDECTSSLTYSFDEAISSFTLTSDNGSNDGRITIYTIKCFLNEVGSDEKI